MRNKPLRNKSEDETILIPCDSSDNRTYINYVLPHNRIWYNGRFPLSLFEDSIYYNYCDLREEMSIEDNFIQQDDFILNSVGKSGGFKGVFHHLMNYKTINIQDFPFDVFHILVNLAGHFLQILKNGSASNISNTRKYCYYMSVHPKFCIDLKPHHGKSRKLNTSTQSSTASEFLWVPQMIFR